MTGRRWRCDVCGRPLAEALARVPYVTAGRHLGCWPDVDFVTGGRGPVDRTWLGRDRAARDAWEASRAPGWHQDPLGL